MDIACPNRSKCCKQNACVSGMVKKEPCQITYKTSFWVNMAKSEKVIIENFAIKEVFTEDFLRKIGSLNTDIFPVSIVFINRVEKDGKKFAYPVILSHENIEEVRNKLVHVESQNTDLIDSLIKLLEIKD